MPKGKKWQERNPHKLPFAWGYFNGWSSIAFGPSIFLLFFALIPMGLVRERNFEEILPFILVLSCFYFVLGHFVNQRRRWAWILLIVTDLVAPVRAIINIIYLKNRWSEMAKEADERSKSVALSAPSGGATGEPHRFLEKSKRVALFATAFWTLSVIIFVLLFEPYGRIRDDDIIHMLMVIVLPPALMCSAWFIYDKYVK